MLKITGKKIFTILILKICLTKPMFLSEGLTVNRLISRWQEVIFPSTFQAKPTSSTFLQIRNLKVIKKVGLNVKVRGYGLCIYQQLLCN